MFNFFKKKFKDESSEDQRHDLEKFPIGLKDEALAGLDCDFLPNASGEFARCITNPIPVNGPIGEIKYLNRLISKDGGFISHRLGSYDELDVYEVVSIGGKIWDVLYFDMYHPRRSTIAPSDYDFNIFHEIFTKFAIGYSTNSFDQDFPFGLSNHIEKRIGSSLGTKIAKKYEEIITDRTKFIRPSDHVRKLDQIKLTGRLS